MAKKPAEKLEQRVKELEKEVSKGIRVEEELKRNGIPFGDFRFFGEAGLRGYP